MGTMKRLEFIGCGSYTVYTDMKSLLIAVLLGCSFQGDGLRVTEPSYPDNAFQGGTVVAALEVRGGRVSRVQILKGDPPFVDATRTALSQWRFPRKRGDRPALVIVNFRSPNLYSFGTSERKILVDGTPDSLPQPTSVVEPVYPPNSPGPGSVVLQMKLGDSGSPSEVKTVKGAGVLAQACDDAVRKWKLTPARNSSGEPSEPDAFAVCVFRRPVLSSAPK